MPIIYKGMPASEMNNQIGDMEKAWNKNLHIQELCHCGRSLIATRYQDWGYADNDTNFIFECPLRRFLPWHDKTNINFPLKHPGWDAKPSVSVAP